jgi:hypothetical protein
MTKRKPRIWGLFYLGDEIDRFDGNGQGVIFSKKEAEKAFMLDVTLEVKEIKKRDDNGKD